VSLAASRAASARAGLPLYRYLNADAHLLPVPLYNLINGGRHAAGSLDFQEFIILPTGASSFSQSLEIATEVNLALHDLLVERHGAGSVNTGDEGGYAPPIRDPREALEFLHNAVAKAGYTSVVEYGLDCAATHLYDAESHTYSVGDVRYEQEGLLELYCQLIDDFDIVTLEDPFHEDDFAGFAELTRRRPVQVVGDDLFCTNVDRLRRGLAEGAGNALLWKVNQVGTLSEAWDAATLATRNGLGLVVSERSGETEDPIIADLTVALGAGQIKTGAPVRGERTAKYNRLLKIEEELGSAAIYAGLSYRRPS
jgi:enolase